MMVDEDLMVMMIIDVLQKLHEDMCFEWERKEQGFKSSHMECEQATGLTTTTTTTTTTATTTATIAVTVMLHHSKSVCCSCSWRTHEKSPLQPARW